MELSCCAYTILCFTWNCQLKSIKTVIIILFSNWCWQCSWVKIIILLYKLCMHLHLNFKVSLLILFGYILCTWWPVTSTVNLGFMLCGWFKVNCLIPGSNQVNWGCRPCWLHFYREVNSPLQRVFWYDILMVRFQSCSFEDCGVLLH